MKSKPMSATAFGRSLEERCIMLLKEAQWTITLLNRGFSPTSAAGASQVQSTFSKLAEIELLLGIINSLLLGLRLTTSQSGSGNSTSIRGSRAKRSNSKPKGSKSTR